jgi:fermentation-respiration switch protein FrsA (DUF1100 family)
VPLQRGEYRGHVLKIIIAVVVILIFFSLFIRFIEQRSLYYPFKAIEATPKAIGLDYEDVTITTDDGIQLTGWFIPSAHSRATILLSHGNGGNISHRLEKIQVLHALDLDVLAYDYRGYGGSAGRPSEDGLYRDAQAVYDYLRNEKKVAPQKIISYGESLGGAVAIDLAVKRELGALIVESGFTSIHDMAKKIFGVAPSILIHAKYDSVDKIRTIQMPKLIMHSPDDEVVPFLQGRRLFENAPEPKVFVELQGGHNDGFLVSGEVYSKGIDEFIKKWLDK